MSEEEEMVRIVAGITAGDAHEVVRPERRPFIDRFQYSRYIGGFLTTRRRQRSLGALREGAAMMAEMGLNPLRSVRRPHGKWYAISSRSRIMLRRLDGMRERFKRGFLPCHMYRRLTDDWLKGR
jgi:hypothetical protein